MLAFLFIYYYYYSIIIIIIIIYIENVIASFIYSFIYSYYYLFLPFLLWLITIITRAKLDSTRPYKIHQIKTQAISQMANIFWLKTLYPKGAKSVKNPIESPKTGPKAPKYHQLEISFIISSMLFSLSI